MSSPREDTLDDTSLELGENFLPLRQAQWPDDVKILDGSPVFALQQKDFEIERRPGTDTTEFDYVNLKVPKDFRLGSIWHHISADMCARALLGAQKLLESLFIERLIERDMSDEIAEDLYGN